MRMFCVEKIRGFLFPVHWMSELRVWQKERLWPTDGRWRMDFCHVLTVWVDVVESFDSARQNHCRNFNRLMKNCSLCVNLEPGVVRFGLWCCGSSNESLVVLGW